MFRGRKLETIIGVARLSRQKPSDGLQIAVSGYPFTHTVLHTNIGWLATAWAVEEPRTEQELSEYSTRKVYLANLTVNGGNSGGPVYSTETGEVIGVCRAFQKAIALDQNNNPVVVDGRVSFYNAGIAYIVPTQFVIELLEKNNIRF